MIERGTSGIWTYRKWSSGDAECWGLIASKSYAMTGAWGAGYYSQNNSVSFPSGLFVSTPIASLNIIEIKYQEVAGSVDEKLQTCDFKKKQYERLLRPLKLIVEYCYVLR